MTELKYLPSGWLDECIPAPQAKPDSFIFRDGNAWTLRPPEDADEYESCTQLLRHGEIVLFRENRVFGDFLLTIDADGNWTTDHPIPSEATHFRFEWSIDTIANSVEELISANEMKEGQFHIDAYWWSNFDVPLRFMSDNGAARFERIERAEQ